VYIYHARKYSKKPRTDYSESYKQQKDKNAV